MMHCDDEMMFQGGIDKMTLDTGQEPPGTSWWTRLQEMREYWNGNIFAHPNNKNKSFIVLANCS